MNRFEEKKKKKGALLKINDSTKLPEIHHHSSLELLRFDISSFNSDKADAGQIPKAPSHRSQHRQHPRPITTALVSRSYVHNLCFHTLGSIRSHLGSENESI